MKLNALWRNTKKKFKVDKSIRLDWDLSNGSSFLSCLSSLSRQENRPEWRVGKVQLGRADGDNGTLGSRKILAAEHPHRIHVRRFEPIRQWIPFILTNKCKSKLNFPPHFSRSFLLLGRVASKDRSTLAGTSGAINCAAISCRRIICIRSSPSRR